jgi:23S rRNA (cytosine1962-C5)-methyltransferase
MAMTSNALPCIYLQMGHDRRIAHGSPWAYSNEIRMNDEAKALPAGSLVTLLRIDGKPFGIGMFNPHALIAVRLLDRNPDTVIDAAFLAERFRRALDLRMRLFSEPFYRLIHAEADALPGLIADRFDNHVVLQINTAGMDRLTSDILAALATVLGPRTVVLRNDSRARALEGLPRQVRVVWGDAKGCIRVKEMNLWFYADPVAGQKTGWFYDQRPNRRFVAPLAAGRTMLDVYCHSGAFAVTAAAAGAVRVLGIDSSEAAIDLARRAAAANALAPICTFQHGEAFASLEAMAASGERFGVVVADPPAFVKSRKELNAGLRGYRKLARLAATVVEPGGFLFVASCSHLVEPARFAGEVVAGMDRAGRKGRILCMSGAGPDHPVHPHLPETAYLKTMVLQVD